MQALCLCMRTRWHRANITPTGVNGFWNNSLQQVTPHTYLSLSSEPMAHLRQGLREACTIIYLSLFSLCMYVCCVLCAVCCVLCAVCIVCVII